MDRDPKRDLPGVKYGTGHYTNDYTGTKQALVAAGIAKPDWFPRKIAKMFRKDGRPFLRYGRQKTQRKYPVGNVTPETAVLHGRDPSGKTIWTVTVADVQARAEAERRYQEYAEHNLRYSSPRHLRARYVEPEDKELRCDVLPVQTRGRQFDIRGWCVALGDK